MDQSFEQAKRKHMEGIEKRKQTSPYYIEQGYDKTWRLKTPVGSHLPIYFINEENARKVCTIINEEAKDTKSPFHI